MNSGYNNKLKYNQMKTKSFALIISLMTLLYCAPLTAQQETNDFYDDAPTMQLGMPAITVVGEIAASYAVDFSKLQLRSVVVKETLLRDGKDEFVGAYRYDGYSLYDILNQAILKKKNEEIFKPIIDLYVEVENARGEKVVISWGEIYYPIHRHEIMIATAVARIIPSKTKELWPLPTEPKLVIAADLVTERNISTPSKITVKSYSGTYPVNKGMKPMYAGAITFQEKENKSIVINEQELAACQTTYPSVFYGRGTGIHGITNFKGVLLKDFLKDKVTFDAEALKHAMLVTIGRDGYRCVYTFSEVFNRNDQAELLLFDEGKGTDGGRYKLFPAADIFSDRAIKSLIEIRLVD
jgi:hypothetical protein